MRNLKRSAAVAVAVVVLVVANAFVARRSPSNNVEAAVDNAPKLVDGVGHKVTLDPRLRLISWQSSERLFAVFGAQAAQAAIGAAVTFATGLVARDAAMASARVTGEHPSPVAPIATIGGRIPYDPAVWLGVHQCEQPETWHAGGHFGNGLPSGGNGLGFSLYAWRDGVRYAARRGVVLPASGWDATPDQQMQVAQAMLDATGGGPDCLRR